MDIMTAVQTKVPLKPNGKRHGAEFVGPCPFCRDGEDRFHVWPEHTAWKGGGYWCRHCGEKGDLIEFLRRVMGYSYHQACDEVGIDPDRNGCESPVYRQKAAQKQVFIPTKYEDPKEVWTEKALKFVEYAHEQLMSNPVALDRLLKDRGLSLETAVRFKIGMNPKDFYRPREAWGLETEISDKTGKPKKLWIPRGLVIPYIVDGKVKRVRVRRPKADVEANGGPRYYFTPGSTPEIMMIGRRCRAFVVVESELDGFLLAQTAGDLVGVAALGTSASKPDASVAADIAAASVIMLSLDSDEAGRKACKWWKENYPAAYRVPVIEGKDPGDMFKSVDVRKWVIAGLPEAWYIPETKKTSMEKPLFPPKTVAVAEPKKPSTEALPETISELGALLQRYPVRIYSTSKRLKIDWPQNFQNDEVSGRISRLVFFDEDVSRFIGAHPNEKIDGRNFFNSPTRSA